MSVRTGAEAAAWFRAQVGKDAYHNMCKAFVRTGLNVVPSTSGTAIECFREAQHKHLNVKPDDVPAYVPVFMDTSASAEHVVFSMGRNVDGHRLCVSTDAGPGSTIGLIRLDKLAASWGPILGWTEDLDGQRVWTPPTERPKPPAVPIEHLRVINGMNDDHMVNLDELSAVQRTGRQPYADAANAYHDALVVLHGKYVAATKT